MSGEQIMKRKILILSILLISLTTALLFAYTCPTCDGEGEVTCYSCEGTGTVVYTDKDCPMCDGEGYITCPSCGGRGEL